MVVLGIDADSDIFSWATLVDLPGGTTINFTDNGISGGEIRGGEGTFSFTAPATGVAAGNIFTAPLGGLSSSGDQVLAYTGLVTSPTYLFIAQSNSTQFQSGSDDSNQSDLPPGLAVGLNAVAAGAGAGVESEFDNVVYDFSVTAGTPAELLAAIADAGNWLGRNSPSYSVAELTGGLSAFSVSAIPEPTAALFGSLLTGTLGLTLSRRSRREA